LARLLWLVSIAGLAIGCDQATKHVARSALEAAPGPSLLWNSLHFELVYNHGGFLSLGASFPEPFRSLLFGGIVPALLAGVAFIAVFGRSFDRWQIAGLALILGGGIGNMIDRLLYAGAVTDFVRIGVGPVSTGIFNVSDVAILAGVAVIALLPSRAADRRATSES
jgi:signal peptidase II